MRVLIFGASGMLGEALYDSCIRAGLTPIGISHRACDITDLQGVTKSVEEHSPDVLVNAAGIIPTKSKPDYEMMRVNGYGPFVLAEVAKKFNVKMLHISTDCVFSGKWPSYNSVDKVPDPTDLYGASKRAGEFCNSKDVTVVRTSFIGFQHGLLRWVLDQPQGATIEGWSRAYWSGSSVYAVASSLTFLMQNGPPGGIQQLATEQPITKYEVLSKLIKAFRPDLRLEVKGKAVFRAMQPTLTLDTFESSLPRLIQNARS